MTVETITLRGDPSRELLGLAKASKADLIVCGTHGQGFISRMLLGSVATTLVRGSPCPLLVVPQPRITPTERRSGDRRAPVGTRAIELPKSEWPARLKTFTERNAGRHCRIEVDDPAIGSQAQAFDYPLRGVAFDRRDDRLEIMLGDSSGALHLSRGISGVTSLSLVVDEGGRDRLLRISYADGQTLLFVELWGDKGQAVEELVGRRTGVVGRTRLERRLLGSPFQTRTTHDCSSHRFMNTIPATLAAPRAARPRPAVLRSAGEPRISASDVFKTVFATTPTAIASAASSA